MRDVRIGCSGWVYGDWRGTFYPQKLPQREWLRAYAERLDTVEVNSTFYRLPRPDAVANWVRQTPQEFGFAVKGSRYLTHIRRLQDRERGLERFYGGIAPLVESRRLGPVLWQLPESFHRDDDRLDGWLAALPAGRHALEFRHASWWSDAVHDILRAHGAALVIADRKGPLFDAPVLTTDLTFIRLHHGARGRRGNYSDTELRAWASRIAELREHAEAWVYFNNDWEAFAPRNALRLRRLLVEDHGAGEGR